jgi:hypothetical protein
MLNKKRFMNLVEKMMLLNKKRNNNFKEIYYTEKNLVEKLENFNKVKKNRYNKKKKFKLKSPKKKQF